MFRNYIKIAWRDLVKNKFYSLINIAGMAIGLAIGILILLWVNDELSFDKFHQKATRIYQVNSFWGTGNARRAWPTTQGPVATYALKEILGVENAVRIASGNNGVFTYRDKLLMEEHDAYTDPSFFRMFDFRWIAGNQKVPFPDDRSVIITQSTALKYFGSADPIGKVLQKDHKDNYRVTGVIADFPDNSSINYAMLFPMNIVAKRFDGTGFWKSLDSDWGNFGYTTFLEVKSGTQLKPLVKS